MSPSPRINRILTGVDGSDDARAALDWATYVGSCLDAEIIAVHAVGLLEHLSPAGEPVDAAPHRAELERVFHEDWTAPLDADGVRGRRLLRDGPPAMVLLRVAEQEDVDLIVVGSRGVGGFPELQLGSTSTQVVQHARVPVTVLPRPATSGRTARSE